MITFYSIIVIHLIGFLVGFALELRRHAIDIESIDLRRPISSDEFRRSRTGGGPRAAIVVALLVPAAAGCGESSPGGRTGGREGASPPVPAASAIKPSFARDVAPVLTTYCLGCHDEVAASGGVVLAGLEEESRSVEEIANWSRVADALRSGEMPPEGEPRPTEAEVSALSDWLEAEVFRCDGSDPGRVALRRLNRLEYNNTVRDLVGLDLRPADDFPADDVGHGFDNNADVLSLPPILLEKYLAAAEAVVDSAFHSDEARRRIMEPTPDVVPFIHRAGSQPARDAPRKRVGVPAPAAMADDPATLERRRAVAILRGFADCAYRRPATYEELDRLAALVESGRRDGDDFERALKPALAAVLASPHFLFRVERDDESGLAHPVGDFELASRLSYFLWSSMPDAELSDLALRGTLRDRRAREAQVRRMLRDPKARALADGFASQWLGLGALNDFAPDPASFPDFDEPLRRSALRETGLFCEAIVREDRSVMDFLDAEYTFIDGRLARHYGIPGVVGDSFRRVSLAGTPRGGVLTHASVLMLTSNPTRTSPVKRGKWVLDNLLGSPPPAPPPGVEALKERGGKAHAGTLRQRMEDHRSNPDCASCHRRMDSIGFGLENFGALGAWRDRDEAGPVDASGTLPGGASFRGPAGLRAALAAKRGAFARCLAEKLLAYALGRGLTEADRCVTDAIARQLTRDDPKFSTLVLGIVESTAFLNRKGPRGGP